MKKLTILAVVSVFVCSLPAVHAQPTITVQPLNRSVNVGDNAQFSIVAAGRGTVSYQWRFNDADIPDATIVTNNFVMTNTAKAGPYTVDIPPAGAPQRFYRLLVQ